MDQFILNGNINYYEELDKVLIKPADDDFEYAVLEFIKKWRSGEHAFSIQTSGSTGAPKKLIFTRQQMIRSAERSIAYFGLKPENSILLCLPANFIAGKMMLVRALVGNLQLVALTPSSNPFQSLEEGQKIDFAAVTPMQIETALRDSPEKIQQIHQILIGGVGIHPELEARLRKEPGTEMYHSFSMTETLTHIAMRKINKVDPPDEYVALKGVDISMDERSCLVIKDTHLQLEQIVTNDIVEIINSSKFRWIGRYDLVVNSGGIKIHIEKLEQQIGNVLRSQEMNFGFCVLAQSDPRLTDRLVLIVEGNLATDECTQLLELLKKELPRHHAPKKVLLVPKLLLTKSGKIDRIKNAREYLDR